MGKIKKRVFEIIQVGDVKDVASVVFDWFIVCVILLNIGTLLFETFEQSKPYIETIHTIEAVSTVIFIIEYSLRIWTADLLFPDSKPLKARLLFIISFFGVIDLLSILPALLPMILPSGMIAFRILRVIRIFRLFRVNSRYDAFSVIGNVVKEKSGQLLSSMVIIFMLMIASSLIMYNIEHEAQPDNFTNAFSGIWWTVSTMLTVGYGDIYPVTMAGKMMAIVISFLGVGLVSIPTGIISAGFVEHYSKETKSEALAKNFLPEDSLIDDFIFSRVSENHKWVGKRIGEITTPPGLFVAIIKRDTRIIKPTNNTIIKANDLIILQTENGIEM